MTTRGSNPDVSAEPLDERTKQNVEALKIVNKPRDATALTVPDLLRQYKPLFFEKGLLWIWHELDDASGNEASTKPGTSAPPMQAQPLSNP